MRLLTYGAKRGRQPRLGVLVSEDRVLDIGEAARRAKQPLSFDATSMVSLIESGRSGLALIRRVARHSGDRGVALSGVRLMAPIPNPVRNVFCVGWNYVEHFAEGARARPLVKEMPAHPAFFTKATRAMNGPYDSVPLHAETTQTLDWEVELGVVIGRGGRDIDEADAMKHVFGYMAVNDVSAREVQRQHGQQWFKGKSLDGTCPTGPWIVTKDEIDDPHDLQLTCRVNGVAKQDSNTRFMYFRIPRIIAELSAGLTLQPGDIISTGTPAGVGHARTPPEFMKAGDVLETSVFGIGTLRNTIGR